MDKLIFADFEQELAGTRRLLERLPDEHFDWRPHPKSMTLGDLATHVANLPNWQTAIVRDPETDLAKNAGPHEALPNRAAILAEFDAGASRVTAALAACTAPAWQEPWTLRHGDHVIFQMPRAAAFRTSGLSHLIHHRAQLGVYLRLLDVPVPGLYGPSADDQGA